jgi:hypothetical protein
MSTKPPSELLYDSEAALRLVDGAIKDIGDLETEEQPVAALRQLPKAASPALSTLGLLGLSDLMARGYAEILGVLDSLRQSRNLLERATVDKLQHTHDKLREVSSATETAATDILNGLDRANVMIDDLDAIAVERGDDDKSAQIRTALRDELFALMGHMQFQDITSQQLNYASAVLTEMEQRLAAIARVFEPGSLGDEPPPDQPAVVDETPRNYDPEASTKNREERQAIADSIIAARRVSS